MNIIGMEFIKTKGENTGREVSMYQSNQSFLGKDLKKLCCIKTAAEVVSIPVALLNAQLLSVIVGRAASGSVAGVVRYAAALLSVMLLAFAILSAAHVFLGREELKAANRSKLRFLECFLKNPPDRLFRTDYGELTENLTADMEKLTRRYTELYPGIFSSLAGTAGYFLFLLVQSPAVSVSLLGIALIQLFPPLLVKKYMQVSYDECEELEAAVTNHVAEAVEGFETIKLYRLKSRWQQKLKEYYRKYLRAGRKADAAAAAQRGMYRLSGNLMQFGTYALIGFYVMTGCCGLDAAVQAIYLSGGFFSCVQGIFSGIPEIAVSGNAQKRIGKWLGGGEELSDSAPAEEIRLRRVSYRCKEKDILRDVSVWFDPEKNYFIKGSNGTGKTTLLNLLAGLLLPAQGELRTSREKGFLFYIPQQDPEYHCDIQTLFQLFGEEKQKKLTLLAERFGLSERMREGKEICRLSGGERKKVFLTVGFAMESRWLLLDEPSNNLDSEGKNVLLELLRERKGLIVVSHDPALSGAADETIRLEDGRICDEKNG